MRGLAALSLCVFLLPRPARADGGWDRNGFDSDDLAAINRRAPALGVLFLRGESELHSGSPAAAAASFKQVVVGAPENALAQRRYCQALTELGERQAAISACNVALEKRASAPAFRALVGALMSGRPTPDELNLATQLAYAAQRRMDDQPWGLAALSDIAERTGDEKMLQSTVLELERIAPGHYETLRARQALDSFLLPNWAWAGWLGLGIGVLGTGLHAAWGSVARGKSRRRAVHVAGALALAAGTLFSAAPASAADAPTATAAPTAPVPGGLSQWPINDANPKSTLPTPQQRDGNPLEFGYHLMDLADKADMARKKGDFAAVGRYYEALATAVPDRAIGYRRSCDGYEQAGDLEKALQMCRGALAADGVEIGDYSHFAKLLMARPEALSATDTDDLTQIVQHLKGEQGAMASALQIQCDLAQKLDDVKRLEDCAAAVSKETPDDPKLVIYQWGIAMKKEDYRQARQLIAQARKSPLLPAGIEVMERTTNEQSAIGRRVARAFQRHALGFGVGLALLVALVAGFLLRRRFGLRLPSGSSAPTAPSAQ